MQAPEMVRVPLEELVLQIHLLGLGPAGEFLEKVLEPPPKASVEGALTHLQALGALTPDQQLTPLGQSAASIITQLQKKASVRNVSWTSWHIICMQACSLFDLRVHQERELNAQCVGWHIALGHNCIKSVSQHVTQAGTEARCGCVSNTVYHLTHQIRFSSVQQTQTMCCMSPGL